MSTTTPAAPARHIGVGATLVHTGLLAGRNLLHLRADPAQIIAMTVQPLLFLLMFLYVFGGAVAGTSTAYLQYALPGFLVQAVAFTTIQTAIGLNVDFRRGIIDRFRTLNMAPAAVVAGRVVADLIRILAGIAIVAGFGVLLGFRFHGPLPATLLGLALITALGFALCWPMAAIGITGPSPETVNLLTFLTVLPLTWVSSVFAPPETMPGWLQPVVKANPITAATDAARDLLTNGTITANATHAGLWSLAIVALFAPLAVALYRRRR
jgi:ABC transporter DrrB family efflux protein